MYLLIRSAYAASGGECNPKGFNRCVVCNAPLRPAGPGLGARFAEASLNGRREVNACPCCERLYWEGDHVRRMRARLERWAAAAAGESES